MYVHTYIHTYIEWRRQIFCCESREMQKGYITVYKKKWHTKKFKLKCYKYLYISLHSNRYLYKKLNQIIYHIQHVRLCKKKK